MSDIIVEDASIKTPIKRHEVLVRALLYIALAVGVCSILPAAKEMVGKAAVLFAAGFCMLLLLVLFALENAEVYKYSGLKKWKKYAAIDLICVCVGMIYWFIAHALWYKMGEVRFYDAIILAVLALPYIYRVYRIFGLPKPRENKGK